MELFFVSTDFMTLQIILKGDKLYSVLGIAPIKNPLVFKSSYYIDEKDVWSKKSGFIPKNGISSSKLKPSGLATDLKKQFRFYFGGKAQYFEVKLYQRGTPFQQKVWKAIHKIPWGQVTSYSQLAQAIKKPKAFRAVGSCCAKNPFLIIVPCHRVLAKHNKMGGFALGLNIKKQLLKLEKA